MYYPYCTIGDSVEVVHTPLNDNGETIVHIEIPDEVYCFREMNCAVPGYHVSDVIGMSDEEVAKYVDFCRHNAHLLLECASKGGIVNA